MLTLLDGRAYDLTDQSSARVAVSDSVDRQQRVEDISHKQVKIFYLT